MCKRVHGRIIGEYTVGSAYKGEGTRDKDSLAEISAMANVPKKSAARQLIRQAMGRAKLFTHLHPEQHRLLVDCMARREYAGGEAVVKRRQATARYFVLESGECVAETSDGDAFSLARGASFGEAALVHETVSSRCVRAVCTCVFWSMERRRFLGETCRQNPVWDCVWGSDFRVSGGGCHSEGVSACK